MLRGEPSNRIEKVLLNLYLKLDDTFGEGHEFRRYMTITALLTGLSCIVCEYTLPRLDQYLLAKSREEAFQDPTFLYELDKMNAEYYGQEGFVEK